MAKRSFKTVGDMFNYLQAQNITPQSSLNDVLHAVDPTWTGNAGDLTGSEIVFHIALTGETLDTDAAQVIGEVEQDVAARY